MQPGCWRRFVRCWAASLQQLDFLPRLVFTIKKKKTSRYFAHKSHLENIKWCRETKALPPMARYYLDFHGRNPNTLQVPWCRAHFSFCMKKVTTESHLDWPITGYITPRFTLYSIFISIYWLEILIHIYCYFMYGFYKLCVSERCHWLESPWFRCSWAGGSRRWKGLRRQKLTNTAT